MSTKQKELGKFPLSIIAFFFTLAGVYAILEPNLTRAGAGSGTYSEFNTIGRLGGWVMLNMGFMFLAKTFPIVERLRSYLFARIKYWNFFFIGFFFIAIVSGSAGVVLGKNFGIERVVHIRDPLMRLAEGIYALLGVIAIFFYRKHFQKVEKIMMDIEENSKKSKDSDESDDSDANN